MTNSCAHFNGTGKYISLYLWHPWCSCSWDWRIELHKTNVITRACMQWGWTVLKECVCKLGRMWWKSMHAGGICYDKSVHKQICKFGWVVINKHAIKLGWILWCAKKGYAELRTCKRNVLSWQHVCMEWAVWWWVQLEWAVWWWVQLKWVVWWWVQWSGLCDGGYNGMGCVMVGAMEWAVRWWVQL